MWRTEPKTIVPFGFASRGLKRVKSTVHKYLKDILIISYVEEALWTQFSNIIYMK